MRDKELEYEKWWGQGDGKRYLEARKKREKNISEKGLLLILILIINKFGRHQGGIVCQVLHRSNR